MRFHSSLWILFLISAFSLLALKIESWPHLILNLLIDRQFIFFWKISVVWVLVKLIYSINFQTFDSFLSYKLVLYLQMVQINYPTKTTGELVVKLNVTKISIYVTQFSRDVLGRVMEWWQIWLDRWWSHEFNAQRAWPLPCKHGGAMCRAKKPGHDRISISDKSVWRTDLTEAGKGTTLKCPLQ